MRFRAFVFPGRWMGATPDEGEAASSPSVSVGFGALNGPRPFMEVWFGVGMGTVYLARGSPVEWARWTVRAASGRSLDHVMSGHARGTQGSCAVSGGEDLGSSAAGGCGHRGGLFVGRRWERSGCNGPSMERGLAVGSGGVPVEGQRLGFPSVMGGLMMASGTGMALWLDPRRMRPKCSWQGPEVAQKHGARSWTEGKSGRAVFAVLARMAGPVAGAPAGPRKGTCDFGSGQDKGPMAGEPGAKSNGGALEAFVWRGRMSTEGEARSGRPPWWAAAVRPMGGGLSDAQGGPRCDAVVGRGVRRTGRHGRNHRRRAGFRLGADNVGWPGVEARQGAVHGIARGLDGGGGAPVAVGGMGPLGAHGVALGQWTVGRGDGLGEATVAENGGAGVRGGARLHFPGGWAAAVSCDRGRHSAFWPLGKAMDHPGWHSGRATACPREERGPLGIGRWAWSSMGRFTGLCVGGGRKGRVRGTIPGRKWNRMRHRAHRLDSKPGTSAGHPDTFTWQATLWVAGGMGHTGGGVARRLRTSWPRARAPKRGAHWRLTRSVGCRIRWTFGPAPWWDAR